MLCHDAEVSLSQAARSSKRLKYPVVREGIASAYAQLGWLLKSRRLHDEAEAFYKKAEKLGYVKRIVSLVSTYHPEHLDSLSLFVGYLGRAPF